MLIPLFNKALVEPQDLIASFVKTNQVLITNAEKMMVFQMNALQSYLDIGINQWKAAAEITDIDSLQDFYKRQTEIAKAVQQKFIIDTKALTTMTVRFKAEMDTLMQATLEDVLPKAA